MKKILSLALAVLMLVSALPVAYAADTQDYSLGTAVSYDASDKDGDGNLDNLEYSITVPASLAPNGSGTVTLTGKWPSNATVKVTADKTVELVNDINTDDKHTLDVTFAGIEKAGDNTVEKTYTETVAVAKMPEAALFGTWSGKFNYNVELVEESTGGTTTEPEDPDTGNDEEATLISFTYNSYTYQAEEDMTWGEWVESEYNINNFFVIQDNKLFDTRFNDVIYNTNDNSKQYADTVIIANATYLID